MCILKRKYNLLTFVWAIGFVCGYSTVVSQEGSLTAKLACAVRNNNKNLVRELLEAGADVNARDAQGRTALCSASLQGHSGMIPLLAKAGADVSGQDGVEALAMAVGEVHYFTVRNLLRAGAHPNTRVPDYLAMNTRGGWNSVMIAAENESRFTLCLLLKRGGVSLPREYMHNVGMSKRGIKLVECYAPLCEQYLTATGKQLRESCFEHTGQKLPDNITFEIFLNLQNAWALPKKTRDTVQRGMNKVSFVDKFKATAHHWAPSTFPTSWKLRRH